MLSLEQIRKTPTLSVVADVNAVPPPGVEGLDLHADGVPVGDTAVLGIGPLAIGNVKYQTEFGLFRKMIEAKKPLLDFRDAFDLARTIQNDRADGPDRSAVGARLGAGGGALGLPSAGRRPLCRSTPPTSRQRLPVSPAAWTLASTTGR